MAEAAAPRRVTRRTFLGWWLASLMTATVITGLAPILVDRKSTRLNSSHLVISYAVFCLKKKKQKTPKLAFQLDRPSISFLLPSSQPDIRTRHLSIPHTPGIRTRIALRLLSCTVDACTAF